MAVNFVTVKSSLKTEEGSKSKFIKLIKNYCVDKYKIAKTISDQCSITEADVVAVLQAYESNLKIEFAMGNSVELFNLGTLKPCFKADYDNNGDVIKDSIRMSKIRLITSKSFINYARGYIYKYCGDIDKSDNTFDIRVDNLKKYLQNVKPTITCSAYAAINECSHVTANRDLKILVDDKLLVSDKVGSTYIFQMKSLGNE